MRAIVVKRMAPADAMTDLAFMALCDQLETKCALSPALVQGP